MRHPPPARRRVRREGGERRPHGWPRERADHARARSATYTFSLLPPSWPRLTT